MRILSFGFIVALALAVSGASAYAASLSGGGSGGGAIEGGSGAPGSGVGVPGAIANNLAAEGIGEDSTFDPAPAVGVYKALAEGHVAVAVQPWGHSVTRQHRNGAQRSAS